MDKHSAFLKFIIQSCSTKYKVTIVSKVFFMRLMFDLIDWVKQIALLQGDGPHPIHWRSDEKKSRVGKHSLSLTVFMLEHWVSPAFTLWIVSEMIHQLSWFSGFQSQTETIPLALLGGYLSIADLKAFQPP